MVSEISSAQPLLDRAQSYFQEFVAPQAHLLDGDPTALKLALTGLGDGALLALRLETHEKTYRRFQETIARYSGALAFLQTQHQSAAAMLGRSPNESLKPEYLSALATGDRLLGVGFSHLRRWGTPPVRAIPVRGGYQIDGQVPWVTGWGYFQEFIVGAMLPDGQSLFGLVPFANTDGERGGRIDFGEPMQLVAMASTHTVTAQLHQWFLPMKRVVSIQPPAWRHEQEKKNVLHHSFFALGCARAGLDIVAEAGERKQQPLIFEAFSRLDGELVECRQGIFAAQFSEESLFEQRLELRARAIAIAVRCAHAAVTVSAGAANRSNHPAGRVYREALAYTVFGQTTAVMEATLAQLVRHR